MLNIIHFFTFSGRQFKKELIDTHAAQKEFFRAMKSLAENHELRKVYKIWKFI